MNLFDIYTEGKPTDGPWEVCDDGINVYEPETDTAITNVDHPCAEPYQATLRANARLIASAPELLGALEDITKMIETEMYSDSDLINLVILRLRPLIAKAKGES